jgi:hypothetical protein
VGDKLCEARNKIVDELEDKVDDMKTFGKKVGNKIIDAKDSMKGNIKEGF